MYWLKKLDPDQSGSGGGEGVSSIPGPAAVVGDNSGQGGQPDTGASQAQSDGASAFQFTPFELVGEDNQPFAVKSPEDLFSFIQRNAESQLTPLQQELEQMRATSAAQMELLAQLRAGIGAGQNGFQQNQQGQQDDDFDIPDFDPLDPESTKAALKQALKSATQKSSTSQASVKEQVEAQIKQWQQEQQIQNDRRMVASEVKKAIPTLGMSDEQILGFAQKALNDPATLAKMIASVIQQNTRPSAKFQIRPMQPNGAQAQVGGLPPGTAPNDISAAKTEWDKMKNVPGYADHLSKNNPARWDALFEIAQKQGWI